jgi:ABC-2 type transport system ATP-binding protein
VSQVRGRDRAERIERLLGFAHLVEFKQRRAAQLSGGMQKKLALACTLVHAPELLLLDEPTTGVDPVSRREFWDILTELHLQGITLVYCTPYMDEAERCSRVGLMYAGRLAMCDTPRRLKERLQGDVIAIWPSDVRRAREALSGNKGILEVQTYGDQLRLLVDRAEALMDEIRATLTRAGIDVCRMNKSPVRMEEAFISLIQREMRGPTE